jgi:hypothetical protein
VGTVDGVQRLGEQILDRASEKVVHIEREQLEGVVVGVGDLPVVGHDDDRIGSSVEQRPREIISVRLE